MELIGWSELHPYAMVAIALLASLVEFVIDHWRPVVALCVLVAVSIIAYRRHRRCGSP